MRVYISADIEGIAGISHWDEAGKQTPAVHTAAISEGRGASTIGTSPVVHKSGRPAPPPPSDRLGISQLEAQLNIAKLAVEPIDQPAGISGSHLGFQ
jgi:hypothetical protein